VLDAGSGGAARAVDGGHVHPGRDEQRGGEQEQCRAHRRLDPLLAPAEPDHEAIPSSSCSRVSLGLGRCAR
jgi:hypothetical protein